MPWLRKAERVGEDDEMLVDLRAADKEADVEGKGEGAPQSSMAGVALSTAAPSVSGTSHREPISRHLS